YVINANPSAQNFYELDVRSNGNVYNFGTLIATGATDVQVNGGPMLDEVVVDRAELPIVFNGGGGGDFCYLGGNPSSPNELSLITSTVTFHGTASAGDKVGIIDAAHTTAATYTVNGNSFNRQGVGQISWDTSVELLTLSTGSGTNQINVTGAPTTTSMTLSGNTAPDTLYADWSAGSSSIDFFGGVSGGGDIAQLDDTAYVGISQPVYSLAAGSVIRTSIPSRGFTCSKIEGIQLQSAPSRTSTFNVNGVGPGTPVTLTGGNAADTFNVTDATGSNNFPINEPLTIHGGDGVAIDTLNYSAASYSGFPYDYVLNPGSIYQFHDGIPVYYDAIEALTLTGPATVEVNFYVYGTSAASTIAAGSGDDNIFAVPRDSGDTATMEGDLQFSGGGGTDALRIDDHLATVADAWLFSFVASGTTTVVGGVGAGHFLAPSDCEIIVIDSGSADDQFTVDDIPGGQAVTLNGNGGNDTFF